MIAEPPPESVDITAESSPDWDFGTIFQILRRRAWVAALWIIIMVAVGILYLLVTPKVYEGKTVVQVEQDERPVDATADVAPEALVTPEILKTFEQTLDSGALLLRVFKTNKLDQDPRYLAEQSSLSGSVMKWLAHTLFGATDAPPSDAAVIREMDHRTMVKLRRGTRLIDVGVRAQDPALALQLSRSLVNEYIRLNLDQKIEAAKPGYEYWLKEVERLKEKLQTSEQSLQTYKEEQRAVSLEETQNIVVETLKSLNASLSDARAARIKLESDVAQFDASGGRPHALLSLPGVAASPDVQALKQRIAELEGVLSSLGQRYTPQSPRYLQAESELHKLKLSLENGIQDAAGIIKATYVSARGTEDKLLAELQAQEKHALDLNRIAIQYNVLSREVSSNEALYGAILKQLKETQIIQGVDTGGVRVVEPATLPDKPAWPKKSIVLAVAMFLGGMIGVVAAVAPILYKAPLMGVADAERQVGIPVLGAIPKGRGRRETHHVFLLDNPRSPTSEAVRSLRAMLLVNARNGKEKIILFTSAMAGEGKTFCAINSAAALAIDGRRTLLIDADLRSPAIGYQLLGKQPSRGLTDILSGQAEFESVVAQSKVENLFILAAGSPTDKPSEILGSKKMAELLEDAVRSFDHVVLDCAPILEASDALRIVKHAQLVCLVARFGDTPSRAVARALQLLTSPEGSPPAGLVLNEAPGGIGN